MTSAGVRCSMATWLPCPGAWRRGTFNHAVPGWPEGRSLGLVDPGMALFAAPPSLLPSSCKAYRCLFQGIAAAMQPTSARECGMRLMHF